GLGAFLKLLTLPLLIVQFRRSDWGPRVLTGLFASCTLLMCLSWANVFRVALDHHIDWGSEQPGVIVKDYIAQSAFFTICVFAFLDQALTSWRGGHSKRAAGLAALAFLFLANILYVATSRTTLVVIPILLILYSFLQF